MLPRLYVPSLCQRFTLRRYASSLQKPVAQNAPDKANKTKTEPKKRVSTKKSTITVTKSDEPLSEEDLVKQIENVRFMSKAHPTFDPWGQRVETLDVILPYPVNFATRSQFPSVRAMLDQFLKNRLNDGKNAVGLWALASSNAIPGFDLSGAGRFQKFVTSWPWRLFRTKSTKTGSWMEPLRRIALSTYQDLNVAVAKGDEKNIKRLTTASYQDDVFRMLKKNQHFTRTCIWRFHREISPTKVLSIRGVEGNLGVDAPKIGNRMMLHALIKFDTEQSLEIYDKRGKALHKSADGGPAVGLGIVPAERRKVTEYLVLEKRMWYDGPWMVREQMYESPPTQ